MLELSQYLDNNYNLDLANAISSIYLGENFAELDNSDELFEKIISTCRAKRLKLFRKTTKNSKVENLEIL